MVSVREIRCPDKSQVIGIAGEVNQLLGIVMDMVKLENSLFDSCVTSYLELQNYPGEKILDSSSFYAAQLSLLRNVMSIHQNTSLFAEIMEHGEYIYSFIERIEYLRKYYDVKKWKKLGVSKKQKIIQIVNEMDILLKQHPIALWQKKQNSFHASVKQINNSSNIWKVFSKNPGAYAQTLKNILLDMDVVYSPMSGVPDTEKKIDISVLLRAGVVVHNRSWKILSKTCVVKAIDENLLDYNSAIIPPQHTFLDFFHANSLKPGEKIDITLYAGNAVFPGLIYRDFDYGYSAFSPIKLHIDNHFAFDMTGIEHLPKGREASIVLTPRDDPTSYTISLMLLPHDQSRLLVPVENIGGHEYRMIYEYDELAKFQYSKSYVISALTSKQMRELSELSEFSEDFSLCPTDLLRGGTNREWGYLPRNTAIYSLSPKKSFTGNLEIPAWILPIFIREELKEDMRMLVSAIYDNKNYIMMLDYHHQSQRATLILPDGLVRIVCDVRKPLVENNSYIQISFENVETDIFILHFGYGNEGLNAIRNQNSAELLKKYPNRIERDAVIRSRDGFDDDNPSTKTYEINSLDDIEAMLLDDYDTNSKLILSLFKKQFPRSVYLSLESYVKAVGVRIKSINEEFGQDSGKNKTSVQKNITLDWDQVKTASDDLNRTAELLGVTYDDDEEIGNDASSMVTRFEESASTPVIAISDGDDAWKPFADALSPAQLAFVRVMLAGTGTTGDLKRLAKQEGKLLDTYFDELNELAVDTFGDVLIDDGEIISEYRDTLSRVLKI